MQQRQESDGPGFNACLTWMVILLRSLAATLEVFLHSRPGSRYPGLYGALGAVCIFMFGAFFPGQDIRPLLRFLVAYLGMCGWNRLSGLWRRRDKQHSMYTGRPRLLWIFPRLDEFGVKAVVEPVLVFLIASWCYSWNEPLGSYLVLAALGLFASVSMTEMWERSRAQDLSDATFAQRQLIERVRVMRGNQL